MCRGDGSCSDVGSSDGGGSDDMLAVMVGAVMWW